MDLVLGMRLFVLHYHCCAWATNTASNADDQILCQRCADYCLQKVRMLVSFLGLQETIAVDSCSPRKDDHGRKGPGRGDFRHQLGREWFGSKWCFRAIDRCHLGPVSHLRDSRRLDLLDMECNLHPGVAWTIQLYAIRNWSSCSIM